MDECIGGNVNECLQENGIKYTIESIGEVLNMDDSECLTVIAVGLSVISSYIRKNKYFTLSLRVSVFSGL